MKIITYMFLGLLFWYIVLQLLYKFDKPKEEIIQDNGIVFRNNTITVDSNYGHDTTYKSYYPVMELSITKQDSLTKEFIKVTDSFIAVTRKGLVLAKQNRENGYSYKRTIEMRKLNSKQWQLIGREKQINRQIDSITNKQ